MSVREPGVHVTFEMFPMLHGLQSKEAGREIFVDKPHARIRVAGYDKDEFFGPANEQIRARFPEEWDAFQRHAEAPTSGTPIGNWPHLFSQPSQVKNLMSLGFRVVEDLAAASDMALQKVGHGAYKLRDAARTYLSGAQVAADTAQVDELKAANATLEAKLAELSAQVAALSKPEGEAEPSRRKKAA